MPRLASADAFACAIAAPGTPPLYSLPHSPVANASVIAWEPTLVRSSTSATREPGTVVEMTFVFQFMLIDVSLYALNTRPAGAVPPLPPPPPPPPSHVTGSHSARTTSGVQSG